MGVPWTQYAVTCKWCGKDTGATQLAIFGQTRWIKQPVPHRDCGCKQVVLEVHTQTKMLEAISCARTASVQDIKLAIQDETGVPPDNQRLFYNKRELVCDDERVVQTCQMMYKSRLELVCRR